MFSTLPLILSHSHSHFHPSFNFTKSILEEIKRNNVLLQVNLNPDIMWCNLIFSLWLNQQNVFVELRIPEAVLSDFLFIISYTESVSHWHQSKISCFVISIDYCRLLLSALVQIHLFLGTFWKTIRFNTVTINFNFNADQFWLSP